MLVEQFHNKYIVIGIQAVDSTGGEIAHVHSIVVKSREGSVHLDVDGMLENLSSNGQQELVDILCPRYSLRTVTDVESKNRRLNQILQTLNCYLVQLASTLTAAPRNEVPPLGISTATVFGSGAQASSSRSTTRRVGRLIPRMQSRVTTEETEPV